MTAAVYVTSIGFQFFLDLRELVDSEVLPRFSFAEANLLVVSHFPEHMGELWFQKPIGIEVASICKLSILDASVIYLTLVVTSSCKLSGWNELSTCKLYSDFEPHVTVP